MTRHYPEARRSTSGELRLVEELPTTLECGGLTPLWYRSSVINNKAASSRRTPRWDQIFRELPRSFINAEELKAKVDGNQPVTIIDVRSPEGYAASSTTIRGALHFKLRKLKTRLAYAPLKNLPKDREIVTYCACPNDSSSIKAAQVLQAGGFTRVRVLQGGWNEWLKASGPVQPK